MEEVTPRLHRLSDSTMVLKNPDDDIRGKKVLDAEEQDIGAVDDLFIDDAEKKVRFMLVSAGGFLGMGADKFLLPIDAIVRIDQDNVYLGKSRDHVSRAPKYDPDLVNDQYYTDVYGYYGYGPFWGAGYMYPGFPFVIR